MKKTHIIACVTFSWLFLMANLSTAEELMKPEQKTPAFPPKSAVTPTVSPSVEQSNSNTVTSGKFGIGFQWSYPAWGVSGKYNLNDQMSIQAILSPFTAIARGLYTFQKEENFSLYSYGSAGTTATGVRFSDLDYEPTFGIGAGIESNWQKINPDLPPLLWNAEVGLNYPFWISLGFGVHFPFDL